MRHIVLSSLLCLVIGLQPMAGQDTDSRGRSSLAIGGFGGPILEFSSGLDGLAFGAGGGGGVILGDFFVGGFGIGQDQDHRRVNGMAYDTDLGMGGLWLGYVPMAGKRFHPYLSARIGWGGLEIYRAESDQSLYEDAFLAIQSDLGVEFNVLPFWKIALVASYRTMEGLDPLPDGISRQGLGGWTGGVTMRFGGFPD